MKITVIGYWGAYPEAESATTCYLLEKDGFSCLLDCGSGALSRLQNYIDIMEIDAVLISHYHQDHIADIGVLQYSWLVQSYLRDSKQILPIYGHEEDKASFQKLTHQCTKGIAYDPTKELQIGPFHINFLKTAHPVPCYAMRVSDGVSTMVYTADSSYIEDFIPFTKDADLLITECSFYENQDGSVAGGHMNSKDCATIARNANVKELWLSHLPHFGDRKELKIQVEKYYNGKIELAREALTWEK
ncbi:MBL fold metallo-hydrolase [Aquibacillus kalidii]|uniref:MBL fold metallo-hydrolase n=1 Tax=Aquibacillus kalidii TaxID=2762597 RepID=UPI001644859D|nr:MBL fold metallo-hydrolase [Aquibacillus kalidii]